MTVLLQESVKQRNIKNNEDKFKEIKTNKEIVAILARIQKIGAIVAKIQKKVVALLATIQAAVAENKTPAMESQPVRRKIQRNIKRHKKKWQEAAKAF